MFPAVILPISDLVGDSHDGKCQGTSQRRDEEHDSPGAFAGNNQGQNVGPEQGQTQQDVGCEVVDVCHLGEYCGSVVQHQVDPGHLEEEHQTYRNDQGLDCVRLEEFFYK